MTDQITVWAVEDDGDDALLLQSAIHDAGVQVNFTSFPESRQFLDFIQLHNTVAPTLLLMDTRLPGYSGMECLQQIRLLPKFSDTQIVMMSTFIKEDTVHDLYQKGAQGYFTKPDSYQHLVHIMKEITASYRMA
ncbi:CheY-like chemotaxis protein [Filimonas zeae]|uniref:Response regulatory domain-containing protein n=1 Tax=Filimonas zeae TaxID=1737353 RepID=A0A917INC5_9BACT|nr:response regulator [Filimonas zeae]MDR6337614.1 CheY-like chemotaxis protein [Filimonas zeae]GGH59464.1 hypothetical protein GCM10011379_06260 [Filimonas zeae]